MNGLRIKRAYRAARVSDGSRILVDRVWPRGITRDRLRIVSWPKDIAPSAELRQWFDHDPAKWDDFRAAYFRELENKHSEITGLLSLLEEGPVTLIYGAKDEKLNNAAALKEYLEGELSKHERSGHQECFLRPSANGAGR